MNARTKKKIINEALAGGEDSTSALAVAMIVPFIHDTELAIAEVKKFIPKDKIGSFAAKICDELKEVGSSSTAKLCYGAFKKDINAFIEKTKKEYEAKCIKEKKKDK
jgi:hypothetical protein